MSLTESIKNNFLHIIGENGTTITNTRTKQEFIALVTSGDFVATFLESDQQTELSLQITILKEFEPRTGDILLIENKKYIVQTIQSRVNSPIVKATLYETRKSR